jgi:hypothetical protein
MRIVVLSALVPLVWLASSCDTEGCLAGDEGCVVPSACTALAFECADPSVELLVISEAAEVPGGLDAMGAIGDFLLRNARVEAVIDNLDHPADLAPTGGALLDLANRDRDDDAINHILQAVGALPEDAVAYTSFQIFEGDGFVALQFAGHLAGDEKQRVHTRYELRACEPGLRMRTEIVNGGNDVVVWSNADGYWWGARSMQPFTPSPGEGYVHPRFGLATLNDVFRTLPYLVGASHSEPASAIAVVPCNIETVEGFHSSQVSAMGSTRRIITPNDYEVYERFIAVRPGQGASPGVDIALELRRQLFAEPFTTVTGRIVLEGGRQGALGEHVRAAVIISEGTLDEPVEARTPITEIQPRADGTFEARVPAQRAYVLDVVGFGAVLATARLDVGFNATDVGDIVIEGAADLTVTVTVDGIADHAQVFVMPADDETAARVTGKYFGFGALCPVVLGNPAGGSPACNRVLVNGPTTFDLPAGRYDLFASAGLFASMQQATVELAAGQHEDVVLAIARTGQPAGTLSADFHVHGAASFDSTIPDEDRVKAFMAAGIDVIVATDHDAVWDYARAIETLDADERLVLVTGVETTGQILFRMNPSVYFPQVIGHWNFWPLPFDAEAPRRGAPWDELVEPGALIGRAAERGYDVGTGVMQLNHPWGNLEFARDLGFPRAIGIRLDREAPRFFDGTGPSLFLRTPLGSAFSNADFHAQEIMNSSNNESMQSMRALWFWELDQGIVRAGTANSDSHSLTDSVVGTPRNLVRTSTTRATFDLAAFNADVRAGHLLGTNGPIIDAIIVSDANVFRPSTAIVPAADGATLRIRVSAPAWVPVREVRVIVNGDAAAVFDADDLTMPDDPFAAVDIVRFDDTIALDALLPGGRRDTWMVVEAGEPLPRVGDLDCDGMPDTSDNNADGVVDFRDVDRDGDGFVTAADPGELVANEKCADNYGANANVDRPTFGPLLGPAPPPRADFGYAFSVVTPGGFSSAFTNPFLFDLNDNGTFDGPGLP